MLTYERSDSFAKPLALDPLIWITHGAYAERGLRNESHRTLMRLSGSPTQLNKEARLWRVRTKPLFGLPVDTYDCSFSACFRMISANARNA